MSTTPTPNFWLLYEQLQRLLDLCDGQEGDKALAQIDKIDAAGFEEAFARLSLSNPADGSLRDRLGRIAEDVATEAWGSASFNTVALMDEVRPMRPRFHLVLIDETDDWDEEIQAKAGQVFACYLYDANRRVHAAELTGSYELHYLYSHARDDDSDAMADVLLQNGAPDSDVVYIHCSRIDGMRWDVKEGCGVPADQSAENYNELLEAELEHFRSNYALTLPRHPQLRMLVDTAIRTIEAGDGRLASYAVKAAMEEPIEAKDAKHRTEHALYLVRRNEQWRAMDVLRTILAPNTGGFPATWSPDHFDPVSRAAVAADLQGGFTAAERKPLGTYLSDDDRRMLLQIDPRYHDGAFIESMGGKSVGADSPFFQHVAQVNKALADSWTQGVEEVYEAVMDVRRACHAGVAEHPLAWANANHRLVLDTGLTLVQQLSMHLRDLLEAKVALFGPRSPLPSLVEPMAYAKEKIARAASSTTSPYVSDFSKGLYAAIERAERSLVARPDLANAADAAPAP